MSATDEDDGLAPLEREVLRALQLAMRQPWAGSEGVTVADVTEMLPLPLRDQAARAIRCMLHRLRFKGLVQGGHGIWRPGR